MKYARVKCHLKLMFCVCVVCFGQAIIGCSFLFMSTLLKELREPMSKIKLTTEEESWIISVSILVCPIGLLVLGVLVDNLGKRIAVQVGLVPATLSWLLLFFADSYQTIIISRILFGFNFGVCSCMMLYITEICPADLRSIYVSVVSLFVGGGMMIESAMSVYMDSRAMSGVLCAMSALNFFALFAVPEPSMWLRAKGRAEEADRTDEWLGLERAENAGAAGPEEVRPHRATADEGSYWSLYARPAVWKPALIMLTFFLVQQCSGVYVLMLYSADVFRSFRVPWDGPALSLSLSVARVLGAVSFALLHRLNRTTLVAVSSCVMAASLLTVVACVRAFHDDHQPFAVLVVAFAAFMFAALLGVLPMPWILCGEVFPMAVKGVMNGIVQTCGYVIWFTICKIYPSMVVKYGADIVWSVFAVFCILNVLFAVFIMPETKGKSLDEVLSYFEPSKKIKKLTVT